MARPPETTILAPASSGRSDLTISSETNRDRGRAARFGRLERRRAHRDDLLGVARLYRLQRIAGIDRSDEGIGAHDLDDLGDRGDIEQGRHAGHEVLAHRCRRGEHGVVIRHQRDDTGREVFGDLLAQTLALGGQHLAHAHDLGRFGGHARDAGARDQHVDVRRQGQGGGDRLVGVVFQRRIVVVGDDEDGHQITPASVFNFVTSSLADSSFTPAVRFAGSVTLRTVRCGAPRPPKSSGVLMSIVFFFAFMMLGSEA
jgi:hypothetical protein